MLEHFDYATYSELLQVLRKNNDNVCFKDFPLHDQASRYFILRHDVDFSPEAALETAQFEARIGVRASYFILFSSPHYNLLSQKHCVFPRRLIELGHEVGLHYDVQVYAQLGPDKLFDTLNAEAEMLARLTGQSVKSIAMHNPSLSGEDPYRNIKEYVNVYDDQYTKQITYLSDSGGAWRDEAIEALRDGSIPARLQLLIHPLFWSEGRADRWSRLEEFSKSKMLELTDNNRLVRECWTQHPGVVQHDKRIGVLKAGC